MLSYAHNPISCVHWCAEDANLYGQNIILCSQDTSLYGKATNLCAQNTNLCVLLCGHKMQCCAQKILFIVPQILSCVHMTLTCTHKIPILQIKYKFVPTKY